MVNHYNEENLKKIAELKSLLKGYNARRMQGTINEDAYDESVEKFVEEFGCDYEFFSNFGVDLLNAEHCDMRGIIEKFVESNCKSWDEYCIYLLEKLIGMIKEKENEF